MAFNTRDGYIQIANFATLQAYRDYYDSLSNPILSVQAYGAELQADILYNDPYSRSYSETYWSGFTCYQHDFFGNGYVIDKFKANSSENGFIRELSGRALIKEIGFTDAYCTDLSYGAGCLIGRIAADDYGEITIARCFVDGYSETPYGYEVGCLIGFAELSIVQDCYSTMIAENGKPGVIGYSQFTVRRCVLNAHVYSNSQFDPFMEYYEPGADGYTSDNYYNSDLVTLDSSQVATGLTTEEFTNKDNFTNFDFVNTWYMDVLSGMPKLRAFQKNKVKSFRNRFNSKMMRKEKRYYE